MPPPVAVLKYEHLESRRSKYAYRCGATISVCPRCGGEGRLELYACLMSDRSTDDTRVEEAGNIRSVSNLTFSFATLATALGLFGCTPSDVLEGHPFCVKVSHSMQSEETVLQSSPRPCTSSFRRHSCRRSRECSLRSATTYSLRAVVSTM